MTIAYVNALAEHGSALGYAFPNRNLAQELGLPLTSMVPLLGYAQPPRSWGSNPPSRDEIVRIHRNMFQGLLNEHRRELAERQEQAYRSQEKRLARQRGMIDE
jgi:hypothetical protein